MQQTKNLKFNKIELTDSPPDITVLNANWDTIDEQLPAKAEKADLGKPNGIATLDTNGKVVQTANNAEKLGNVPAIQYAQKTDVASAVNNIKLGGRNLLANSDIIETRTKDTMTTGMYPVWVVDGYDLDTLIGKELTVSVYLYSPGERDHSLDSSMGNRFGIYIYIMWANDAGGTKATSPAANLLNQTVDGERIHATVIATPPEGYTHMTKCAVYVCTYARPAATNDATWVLSKPMLELGNMPSADWSPAYEDVERETIDSIKIGGRNLIPKSAISSGAYYKTFEGTLSGFGVELPTSTSLRVFQSADIFDRFVLGETYTVSFRAVADGETKLNFDFYPDTFTGAFASPQAAVTTDERLYTLTGVLTNTGTPNVMHIRFWREASSPNYKISIYDIKVEKGNMATDWTPAPEDVDQNINDAVNGIQIGGRNLLLGTNVPAQKGTTDAYVATTVNQRYNYSPIIADDPKAFLLSVKDGYLLFSYDVDVPAIYKDSNQALNRVGAYFSFKITNKTTDAATTWYGTHLTQGVATQKHHYVSNNSLLIVSAQSADSPDSFVGHYSCYLKMSEVPALKDFYANPDDYGVTASGGFAEITGMTKGGCIKNLQLTTGQYEMDWIPAPEDVDQAERLADMDAYIGYTDGDIYGVEVDFANRKFTRLAGAVGRSAGAGFDSIHCFGGRRRCNVANNGTVTAYYGEAGFTTSGKLSNGTTAVQVMVEQPKFYYKVVPLDVAIISEGKNKGYHMRKARYYVSDEPKAGFKLHPAFIENGKTNDFIYLAAFEGSLWDSSASTYILDDAQVADFDADMLSSIANAKPISGLTQNLTRANTRKLAQKRGAGWEQAYAATIAASQLLMLIEYASFDMQKAIGNGVTNKTDDGKTSMTEITGATVNLGNASGSVTNINGYNIVSYRGEENIWGNIWAWIDGMNEENPTPFAEWQVGTLYVADHGFVDDSKASPYKNTGIHPCYGGGYISAFGYSEEYDWLFIPSEHTGNSSLPVGDYTWNGNPGWRGAILGGRWHDGADAGAFYWTLNITRSDRGRTVGGRLVYVPTKADISEEPEDPAPDSLKLGGVEAKNYVQKSDLTTKRCAYIDDATLADGWYYTDDNTTGIFPTGYSKIGVLCVRRSGLAGYTQHYMSQEGEEASRGYSGASWGKWSNGVGTWTPVLRTNTGAAVNATYTTQEGWFSRNGQLVHVGFNLRFQADLSAYSNAVYIGDLPYKACMDEWGGTCAISGIDSALGITQYILRSSTGGTSLMIGRKEVDSVKYEQFSNRSSADTTRHIYGAISYIIAAGK